MLETKQLRIFKTIVDVGSITGAGEQLDLSQPAISQHVRALEEELGVPLLVRVGRGTRPTPAGEMLVQYARQILDKVDEAERVLLEHSRGRAGLVRFGTPEPPCNYLLPPVLLEMKRRAPRVDVRVVSGHTAATLTRLLAGEVDIGFLPLPVAVERLRIVEAGKDELVAIVPAGHPFAERPWLGPRDFEDEPFVLYDRASQITDLTLAFFLDEGVFPRVAVEVDHLEAIKESVRLGLGVAVLPAWAARREVAAGTLAAVRLGPTGLGRTWGLVYVDHAPLPNVLRAVIALCAEALPGLLAGGGAPADRSADEQLAPN